MAETQDCPTKTMFECLAKLYKQGQLLLMDADRLMGERGWEPMHTSAPAELSNSLNSPERWHARYAARFYMPTMPEDEEIAIDRLLFVSIHFASDYNTSVEEPVVSAGRLIYHKPMNTETARKSYSRPQCKAFFVPHSRPHDTLKGWRQTGQSPAFENVKGTETFIVPLYDVTSSEKLEELVIEPLFAAEQQV